MKKTLTTLIITGVLLLSLTGCGALLNGDKQLTDDKLVSSSSTSSNSSSSGSLNSNQATIQLKIYKLTTKTGSTNFWITYTPFSSSYNWVYLFPLNSNGYNSYSLAGGNNSSSYSYKKLISSVTTGYASFSSIGTYDAYFLGRESSSGYNLETFSNVVDSDDIIEFNASSSSNLSVFTGYTYSSSSSSSLSSKPSSWNSTCTSSYKYLWVNLDNRVWVNLGNFYN